MKLATTTGDYSQYTDSQSVALTHIRNAGFKYADYNFGMDYNFKNGIYSQNLNSYLDQINQLTQKLGIKLVQAHSPIGKPFEDGGVLLEKTLTCVDACAVWGIKNLVVHSGWSRDLSRKESLEKNKLFFDKILERAEKYNVNILVENFNKICLQDAWWIDNANELLNMIKIVNHPLFHAVWDVGHANLQEMPQSQELTLLGKHVKALHIQDNMGDIDTHLAPFLGTVNLDDVMNGLLNIGYNDYFTFEVGNFFCSADKRRKYENSTLLQHPPIEIRDAFERYLYDLGKCVLQKYNCFEE